jgi:hypothetical protein
MSSDAQIEVLESLDAKLGGILALLVDLHLRETGVAKPKSRSIDRLLKDGGLDNTEISSLLGKTRRAVEMKLADEK